MNYEIVGLKKDIAYVQSENIMISDADSALELLGTVDYETKCNKIIIDKSAVTEEFFKLSTGIAGVVLQKFINYRKKIAIIGDYSQYTSRPLQDFIYESNRGRDIFFVENLDEAAERLSQ